MVTLEVKEAILKGQLGTAVWQLLEQLNMELPYDPAIPPQVTHLEIQLHPHKNVYPRVHSSIIHNCLKVETPQMSID